MKKIWISPVVEAITISQTKYTSNPGTVNDACFGDVIYDFVENNTNVVCS